MTAAQLAVLGPARKIIEIGAAKLFAPAQLVTDVFAASQWRAGDGVALYVPV